MLRSYDLHQKEVINIRNAERLGFIDDLEVDLETGQILNLVVPRHRFFFFRGDDCIIPWDNVVMVGKDLVLIDYTEMMTECS